MPLCWVLARLHLKCWVWLWADKDTGKLEYVQRWTVELGEGLEHESGGAQPGEKESRGDPLVLCKSLAGGSGSYPR